MPLGCFAVPGPGSAPPPPPPGPNRCQPLQFFTFVVPLSPADLGRGPTAVQQRCRTLVQGPAPGPCRPWNTRGGMSFGSTTPAPPRLRLPVVRLIPLACPPPPPRGSTDVCLAQQKVQRREANRRRHRPTEPTTKALCQTPPPPPPSDSFGTDLVCAAVQQVKTMY